jgi:hypothetical protein
MPASGSARNVRLLEVSLLMWMPVTPKLYVLMRACQPVGIDGRDTKIFSSRLLRLVTFKSMLTSSSSVDIMIPGYSGKTAMPRSGKSFFIFSPSPNAKGLKTINSEKTVERTIGIKKNDLCLLCSMKLNLLQLLLLFGFSIFLGFSSMAPSEGPV